MFFAERCYNVCNKIIIKGGGKISLTIRVGDEIKEYSTLYFDVPVVRGLSNPYPYVDDETSIDYPSGGGGILYVRDMLHTSCGHWSEEEGFEYGCEHIECAMQSLCRGLDSWSDGDGSAIVWLVIVVAALILFPLFGVLLLVILIILSFLESAYDDAVERPKIRRELEEFRKFGTIGGVKAVQLFHHNPQCQHVTPSDRPLDMRLKYKKYLIHRPLGPKYAVTVRKVTNPNDEWLKECRRRERKLSKAGAKRESPPEE